MKPSVPARLARLLTLTVALCTAPLAYSRLGETESELTQRYGPLSTQAQDTMLYAGKILRLWPKLTYRQDDWTIACDIVDGRCERATYKKPGEWTEAEFLATLSANTQDGTWTEISNPKFKVVKREWTRSDGATGLWRKGVGFTFTTPAYLQATKAAAAKAKEQKRQGKKP